MITDKEKKGIDKRRLLLFTTLVRGGGLFRRVLLWVDFATMLCIISAIFYELFYFSVPVVVQCKFYVLLNINGFFLETIIKAHQI